MLQYDEFCKELGIYEEVECPKILNTYSNDLSVVKYRLGCLGLYWIAGGTHGGSCWDDGSCDNHYGVEVEDEPEFDKLTEFLQNNFPELKFSEYNKLLSLMKRDSVTEYEYYGNSTVYKAKWFDPKELYEFLKSLEE